MKEDRMDSMRRELHECEAGQRALLLEEQQLEVANEIEHLENQMVQDKNDYNYLAEGAGMDVTGSSQPVEVRDDISQANLLAVLVVVAIGTEGAYSASLTVLFTSLSFLVALTLGTLSATAIACFFKAAVIGIVRKEHLPTAANYQRVIRLSAVLGLLSVASLSPFAIARVLPGAANLIGLGGIVSLFVLPFFAATLYEAFTMKNWSRRIVRTWKRHRAELNETRQFAVLLAAQSARIHRGASMPKGATHI